MNVDTISDNSSEDNDFLIANCSGCGMVGEYGLRIYRDQKFFRIHVMLSKKNSLESRFCGDFKVNPRWYLTEAESGKPTDNFAEDLKRKIEEMVDPVTVPNK